LGSVTSSKAVLLGMGSRKCLWILRGRSLGREVLSKMKTLF